MPVAESESGACESAPVGRKRRRRVDAADLTATVTRLLGNFARPWLTQSVTQTRVKARTDFSHPRQGPGWTLIPRAGLTLPATREALDNDPR